MLYRVQYRANLVRIIQHSNKAPKFCQLPVPYPLQGARPLSRCFDLDEAHLPLWQDHQPIWRSHPIRRCELQAKTTAFSGGLAKYQFYFAFTYFYHTPFLENV